MDLNGSVNDIASHLGGDNFDHGDVLGSDLSTILVDGVCSFQSQEAGLLDSDAAIGDVMLDDLMFRHGFPEGRPLLSTVAHELKGALSNANQTHAMVDTARSESSLSNFETSAFTEEHVSDRHDDVCVLNYHVSVRCVIIAEYR